MKLFGYNISFERASKKMRDKGIPVDVFDDAGVARLKVKEDLPPMPTSGGRSTEPEYGTTVLDFVNELSLIEPDVARYIYDALEYLAIYNSDVSYAVDNIVQLGGTSFNVYFDDSVSDEQAKEMKLLLKTKFKNWYNHSEGITSLINDLLAQLAITGVLSAEKVVREDLSGIKNVVLVSPKNIKFLYNVALDKFTPYQVVNKLASNSMLTSNLKELNEESYKYMALRRINSKPYGVPPFLSALENIVLERDMLCNFRNIVKKLGVFGFLNVLVTPPKKEPNEDDLAYRRRAESYLRNMQPQIDKGLGSGYVLGFKDVHEFNMQGTTQDATGAKMLFELNSIMKMAGLKQDPLMLGRNFNTTETLGKVILAKMSTQVVNYQKIIGAFLSDLFFTELWLNGYNIKYVEVEFEKPMIGDEVRDAQAYSAKIDNAIKLYNQGILSQAQVAQEVGYEIPDQEEPRNSFFAPEPSNDGEDTKKREDVTDPNTTAANIKEAIAEYRAYLGGDAPEFPYRDECECGGSHTDLSFSDTNNADDAVNRFIRAYLGDIMEVYDGSVKSMTRLIGRELSMLGNGATVEQVTDSVLYHLYRNWRGVFGVKAQKEIKKWVETAYDTFRKDKGVFGTKAGEVPKGTFSTVDLRAIEYYKRSDSFYLGKFITDEDLKKKITKYIKEKYIEENLPIGRNEEALADFKKEFGDLLKGDDWKLRRIIDTTVSKMRNTAAVNYMQQADVEEYEIVGVNDRLQCAYCASLQGKKFSVVKAVSSVDSLAQSDPQFVRQEAPFLTTLISKPEDLTNMTGTQIQDLGWSLVPAHPACRDTIVAVL